MTFSPDLQNREVDGCWLRESLRGSRQGNRLWRRVVPQRNIRIPLRSSLACAIAGLLAARPLANPRNRLVTIMIAPLMTCSARLPVYALLLGAFVPQREPWSVLELQGRHH